MVLTNRSRALNGMLQLVKPVGMWDIFHHWLGCRNTFCSAAPVNMKPNCSSIKRRRPRSPAESDVVLPWRWMITDLPLFMFHPSAFSVSSLPLSSLFLTLQQVHVSLSVCQPTSPQIHICTGSQFDLRLCSLSFCGRVRFQPCYHRNSGAIIS